jgi:hypothetical protein
MIAVFWDVMTCSLVNCYQCFGGNLISPSLGYPEDGGSRLLRNVGTHLLYYMGVTSKRTKIFYVTNSMELSPSWEANGYSATEEIPNILWNSNVHYHVHRSPTLIPVWAKWIQSISPILFLWDQFQYFPLVYASFVLVVYSGFPSTSLSCMLYALPISFSLILWFF